MSVPKGGAQIPPCFLGSGGRARNEGPREGECRVGGEEKPRMRLPRSRVMVQPCLRGVRRSDRTALVTWMGPDLGLLAGGAQGTPRGCSNEARYRAQGSELSLVGWIRGWRGAGRGLPLLGRSGRGRRRNGRGLGWGWGRKGAGAGAGGGWGPGRGRAAGGPDVWGVPLRVRSPSLLASVCRAEREGLSAQGSCTIRTCGDLPPRTWCGSVAAPAVLQGMARVKTGFRSCKDRL